MKLFDLDQPFLDPYRWRYCFHSGRGHQQRAEATADFKKQGELTGTAQGTLSQFEGPVQDSPFYKALKTTGIESTSRAYDNARSGMREKANLSGFGYNQPGEQGADREMSARESSDLARVPAEALLAATDPALRAAGATGNMGMGYGAQGTNLLLGNKSGLWSALQAMGGMAASGVGAYYGNKGG